MSGSQDARRVRYNADLEERTGPITSSIFPVAKYRFEVIKLVSDPGGTPGGSGAPRLTKEHLYFDSKRLPDEFGLSQRDMRNLFVDVSTIEPRAQRTVVSIENLNCIIAPDCIYVHVNNERDAASLSFVGGFERLYGEVCELEATTAFRDCWEMKALECILLDVTKRLSLRYNTILCEVEALSPDAHGERDREREPAAAATEKRGLLTLREELNAVMTDIGRAHDALEDLIDEPEDVTNLVFRNLEISSQVRRRLASGALFGHVLGNDDLFEDSFISYGEAHRRPHTRGGGNGNGSGGGTRTPTTNELESEFSESAQGMQQPISMDQIIDFFEFYLFQLRALRSEGTELKNRIGYQLEVARIVLDEKRNRLQAMELHMSGFAIAIAFGSFIGSLFGMNMKNLMEESYVAFYVVFVLSIAAIGGIVLLYHGNFKKNGIEEFR